MSKEKKRKISKTAVLIGAIIIPIMYSYFYLCAFWDPYSRLDDIKVAIVNEDAGAEINNSDRNIGQEIADKLLDDGTLEFIQTDRKEAEDGTKGKGYYAMIVFPEDFSEDVASASGNDKKTAEIEYISNQKKNYLADQIIGKAMLQVEESARSNVSAEIVDSLTKQVKGIPDEMTELQDGLTQISNGSSSLYDGAVKLDSGANEFGTKLSEFSTAMNKLDTGASQVNSGVSSLQTGVKQITTGTSSLASGAEQLSGGAETLSNGTAQLSGGANQLSSGASQLSSGVSAYVDGVNQLIAQTQQTSAFISQYVQAHPEIMQDPTFAAFIQQMSDPSVSQSIQVLSASGEQLKGASQQVSTGASSVAAAAEQVNGGAASLNSGISELRSGISKLNSGAGEVNSGVIKLNSGTSELKSGTATAATAATQLNSAFANITSGTTSLATGMNELNNGVSEAKSKVDDAISSADEKLTALNGLDDFVSESVNVISNPIYPISNYGTFFAPYFMSLSLWVGALIIFFGIYFDPEKRFSILCRGSSKRSIQSLLYLAIGTVQAFVLYAIAIFALGLEVHHKGLFLLSLIITSNVFVSIVQLCIVHLGDIGKFLAFLLLILQLTSCGGTFPMETIPVFFNKLYKFMPMTYSVSAFKDTISSSISDKYWAHMGILFAILVISWALTIILDIIKEKRSVQKTEEAIA